MFSNSLSRSVIPGWWVQVINFWVFVVARTCLYAAVADFAGVWARESLGPLRDGAVGEVCDTREIDWLGNR